MRSIVRVESKSKRAEVDEAWAAGHAGELDSRVELIQALIPLGLEAVKGLLQHEVTALAGARYQRGGGVPGHDRWGSQSGSVYLADQKVTVTVPRVRDVRRGQEVPLCTYQQLRYRALPRLRAALQAASSRLVPRASDVTCAQQ